MRESVRNAGPDTAVAYPCQQRSRQGDSRSRRRAHEELKNAVIMPARGVRDLRRETLYRQPRAQQRIGRSERSCAQTEGLGVCSNVLDTERAKEILHARGLGQQRRPERVDGRNAFVLGKRADQAGGKVVCASPVLQRLHQRWEGPNPPVGLRGGSGHEEEGQPQGPSTNSPTHRASTFGARVARRSAPSCSAAPRTPQEPRPSW